MIAHGVGFPVGGVRPPRAEGVSLFSESARRLDAVMASEHLAFNEVEIDGRTVNAGYLLPPRQTASVARAAARHIAQYRSALDVPFLVETGVNYLHPVDGELSDGQFVARVAEQADCGILLDLHNAYCNQRNGRQAVTDLVGELPVERVLEVHLAGGFALDGYWLDGHTGAVPDELMTLAEQVLPLLPNLRAVVFEVLTPNVPAMGVTGLRRQLEALHRLVAKPMARARAQHRSGDLAPPGPDATPGADGDWEAGLLAATTRHPTARRPVEPGVELLRLLTDQARLSRIAAALPLTTQVLGLERGFLAAHELFLEYLADEPPHLLARSEAAAFVHWLRPRLGPGPAAEVLRLEAAAFDVMLDGTAAELRLRIDPWEVRAEIMAGRLPELADDERFVVCLTA